MINLLYSLVIEATAEPDFFGFYSPDLDGFTGVGHSVEDCLYKARSGLEDHIQTLREIGLPVPRRIRIRPSSSRTRKNSNRPETKEGPQRLMAVFPVPTGVMPASWVRERTDELTRSRTPHFGVTHARADKDVRASFHFWSRLAMALRIFSWIRFWRSAERIFPPPRSCT